MGATVIAGGDAAPVLEAAEHAFNTVAVLVQVGIVGNRVLAVDTPRDAGADATSRQGGPEPVTVVALISEESLRRRQRRQQALGPSNVTDLARSEQ